MRGALVAVAVMVGIGLTSCGEDRTCIEWHTDTVLMPVTVGKTIVLVPTQVKRCTRYADGRTP